MAFAPIGQPGRVVLGPPEFQFTSKAKQVGPLHLPYDDGSLTPLITPCSSSGGGHCDPWFPTVQFFRQHKGARGFFVYVLGTKVHICSNRHNQIVYLFTIVILAKQNNASY